MPRNSLALLVIAFCHLSDACAFFIAEVDILLFSLDSGYYQNEIDDIDEIDWSDMINSTKAQ